MTQTALTLPDAIVTPKKIATRDERGAAITKARALALQAHALLIAAAASVSAEDYRADELASVAGSMAYTCQRLKSLAEHYTPKTDDDSSVEL